MKLGHVAKAEWTTRKERGAVPLIRLAVWMALRLGRPAAQIVALPVCGYFFLFSRKSRAASRDYLQRVLARPPNAFDRWQHYRCFTSCLIDRVLLLNGQIATFEITIVGEQALRTILAGGGGAFLFGAHLGSFEIVRAVGRLMTDSPVSLVMYEDNARKTNQVLHAVNPELSVDIVGLGKPGSMIAVQERLDAGHLVGVLADRSLDDERSLRIPFLGSEARFPLGPFRMAALLGKPVVLMLGLYRGGRRYDIVFETISVRPTMALVEETLRHYVARLEHHCRSAPYNWFNFYHFWA
jgi:predicted LPLAT superfamily acyltransferase